MERPDRTLPFVFVEDLDDPVLGDGDHHHLARVRRVRPGAMVTVGDGAGRFRLARFDRRCEPAGPVVSVPRPEPAVTVGFALTKSDKPEAAVQGLTEVGVDRIVPFVSARTVVRWDAARATRALDRLRVVAREAAMQAHRPWLPEVAPVATFAEVSALPGVALAHPDGPRTLPPGVIALLVGPEGGWSPDEEAAVGTRVGLGPHVLRATTAAVVAGATLVANTQGG